MQPQHWRGFLGASSTLGSSLPTTLSRVETNVVSAKVTPLPLLTTKGNDRSTLIEVRSDVPTAYTIIHLNPVHFFAFKNHVRSR